MSRVILSLLLLALAAHARTLTVPGTYMTLPEAVHAAAPGDTIRLAPGTYVIDDHLKIAVPLTIASNYIDSGNDADVQATVVRGGPDAVKEWFDILETAAGTKIIGLTLQGNETHTLAIRNPHTEIHRCRFVGGKDQLSFEGGGGLVSHCMFEGATDDAIDADETVDWIIEHNHVLNAKDDGIEIRLQPKSGKMTTHILRHNTFENSTTGIQLIDYDGDSRRRFKLYDNCVVNTRSTGIDCTVHTSDRNTNGSPMVEHALVAENTVDGSRNGITLAPNLKLNRNAFINIKKTAVIRGNHLDPKHLPELGTVYFSNNTRDFDKGTLPGAHIVTEALKHCNRP